MTGKPSDYFIAIIPTLDGTGNLGLVMDVARVAEALGKPILFVVQDKFGVAACLYAACQKVGERFGLGPKDTFRALLVGSDESIKNPETLAEYIMMADRGVGSGPEAITGPFNITTNIRLKGPLDDVMSGGVLIPPETEDLAVVHPKGMGGCYYGTFFVGYPWHNDPSCSEDAYFLKDNPGIEIRFAKRVKVIHYGKVALEV